MSDLILTRLQKALETIENHNEEPPSTFDLAAQAHFSPYHFQRVFKALTGLSPGLYLRRRRLSKAANEVLSTKEPLIEIAVGAGYDSQEAFTRAFKEMFGYNPAQARQQKPKLSFLYQKPLTFEDLSHLSAGGLSLRPDIREHPAFTVTGPMQKIQAYEIWNANKVWRHFMQTVRNNKATFPPLLYGVCAYDAQADYDFTLNYMAGYRVDEGSVLGGFEKLHIPAHTYAVFNHYGPLADFDTTLRYIWQIWALRSGFEIPFAPDFEIYDDSFIEDPPSGKIEVWIPIKK